MTRRSPSNKPRRGDRLRYAHVPVGNKSQSTNDFTRFFCPTEIKEIAEMNRSYHRSLVTGHEYCPAEIKEIAEIPSHSPRPGTWASPPAKSTSVRDAPRRYAHVPVGKATPFSVLCQFSIFHSQFSIINFPFSIINLLRL